TGGVSFSRLLGARCEMLMGMMRRPRIIKDASRVSQDAVATFQSARRRLPTAGKTSLEELSIGRLVCPDGDRRHGAQSGGIVNEVAALEWYQHIMRILVLRENRVDIHARSLRLAPVQRVLEGSLGRHDPFQPRPRRFVEVRVVDERNVTHDWSAPGRLT